MKNNKQKMDLSIKINNKLRLTSPFILGSFDALDSFRGLEKAYLLSDGHFGAIACKTTTIRKRQGYKDPKVANMGAGYLVASGMANPGIKMMCREIAEFKRLYPEQMIFGSIASLHSTEIIQEFGYMAIKMAAAGVDGLELNLSCPHADAKEKYRTCLVAQNADLVKKIIMVIKKQLSSNGYRDIVVIPKLTGWNCDLEKVSIAAERGGADALLISNIFPGTGFYTGLKKISNQYEYKIGEYLIGNKKGGYTGQALHSAVLLMINSVRRLVKIPIIATGGCATDLDSVVQTFFAGANAIEAVTPFYFEKTKKGQTNPKNVMNYNRELKRYMTKHNFQTIENFYANSK